MKDVGGAVLAGLATADDCDDGEEVSRVRLRYPKHLLFIPYSLEMMMFITIFAGD